ncbi:hypothetical protein K488DRAFT_58659, partial [Vararia minispora EC-137]
FTQGSEPATSPRLQEIHIISPESPWCTTVRNDEGVTLHDIFSTLQRSYTTRYITEAEFEGCSLRMRSAIKAYLATAAAVLKSDPNRLPPDQVPRICWLRDRHYFQRLTINKSYTEQRLGISAPNIFILRTTIR